MQISLCGKDVHVTVWAARNSLLDLLKLRLFAIVLVGKIGFSSVAAGVI
jgi:hypothetical protein